MKTLPECLFGGNIEDEKLLRVLDLISCVP